MKKAKTLILLGIILSIIFSGGLVGYCSDIDIPIPPTIAAHKL